MKTLVKINVLTDDPGLPEELREGFEQVLQDAMRKDPEPATAVVAMEFKDTVSSTSYMNGLVGNSAFRVRLPSAPSGVSASKRSAASSTRKASRAGATAAKR